MHVLLHLCFVCRVHCVCVLLLLLPTPPCSMLVAEPSQPQLDQLLQPHPLVANWLQRVRQAVGVELYDEAHGKLRAAVQRLAAAAPSSTRAGSSKL